jgi:hypothetical protein
MKPLAPPLSLRFWVAGLIAITLSAGLACAQVNSGRFTSPEGFSLNVPEGWQVLTKEQSQAVSDEMKARTKFNPTRMAAMIYSPTDPRVNVNVIVLMGAVPMDNDAAQGYAQMLKDQSAQASVTLENFSVNPHMYGPNSALLADYDMDFTNSTGPNKDLGKVHQWQVVFSGAGKTYVVTCTAGAGAFPVVAPVFDRILNSLSYAGSTLPASAAPAPATPVVPAPAPVRPRVQTPVQAPVQPPAAPPAQPEAPATLSATLAPAPVPASSVTPTTAREAAAQAADTQAAPVVKAAMGDNRIKDTRIRMYTPKDADIYCAGFFTDRPPVSDLFVITGAEGGLQELFTAGDTVYLSRGAGYIVRPGGEYMLLRVITDPEYRMEMFAGQNKLIKSMGQLYAEVGRVRVDIVHEYVATAHLTTTCGEILPGDIAVPLNLKPTPPAPTGVFDRFAPASNKNEGLIATGKEFQGTLGVGATVYLNIGADKGVEVGQLYRIFRTFATAGSDPNRLALDETPQTVFGMRLKYKLSKEQRAIMPRDILGELVILSVQGKSATALITMSRDEMFPGDQVELK